MFGVPVTGPTTDNCVGVNGIDWVIEEGKKNQTLTTDGREPATEVLIDPHDVPSSTMLNLSSAVSQLPQDDKCLGAGDTELPDGG